MNNDHNLNQHAKEWWYGKKRVVAVGIVCGIVGGLYGFVKGVTTANKMWAAHDVTHIHF